MSLVKSAFILYEKMRGKDGSCPNLNCHLVSFTNKCNLWTVNNDF